MRFSLNPFQPSCN